MVFLYLTIQNNSSWTFKYARVSPICGYRCRSVTSPGAIIARGECIVIRLEPNIGFMGVECGVGAEFEIHRGDGKVIKFFVKVPACGDDKFSVTCNTTMDNGVTWHNAGKGGSDNQHNVHLTIQDGGFLMAEMVNHDVTLRMAIDFIARHA